MRLAILADIHGNLPALEAVLPEIEQVQPDYVVLDGDLINGTPFSGEVIDLVRSLNWVVVRGNHEFYYLDFGTDRAAPGTDDPERWGQLHWLVKRIRPEQGAYLAMLPDVRTFYFPGAQPLCIAHGVPGHNRVGFSNRQEDAEIAAKIQHVEEPTLISAHTHVQIDRQIVANQGGTQVRRWHLINPGSVGMPLNKDPRAQFAVIETTDDPTIWGGWQATHVRVAYDRRPVLAAFESSGMLAAGGIISQLFYWELCTAEPEIIFFYRWCWQNGQDPDLDARGAFEAYKAATGRAEYARAQDPL
ncbi:MAG: metallophosphoesterase family protein [Caldilineaceae bacterium]|nr:metallophosphoesterase family protein [Caldilineaceae bacterium]